MVTPARPSALSPARRGGVAILVVLGCENAKMVTPARPSALSPARRGGVAILVVLGCENAKMVTLPAISFRYCTEDAASAQHGKTS